MIISTQDYIELTPEQQEQMYWDDWKFHSHKWIEYDKGYYHCEFCKLYTTSMTPISGVGICQNNPYINK